MGRESSRGREAVDTAIEGSVSGEKEGEDAKRLVRFETS